MSIDKNGLQCGCYATCDGYVLNPTFGDRHGCKEPSHYHGVQQGSVVGHDHWSFRGFGGTPRQTFYGDPPKTQTPKCQSCHQPNGIHSTGTARVVWFRLILLQLKRLCVLLVPRLSRLSWFQIIVCITFNGQSHGHAGVGRCTATIKTGTERQEKDQGERNEHKD